MQRKQARRRLIWRIDDLNESNEYVMLLLENETGLREFELRAVQDRNKPVDNSECKFITETIPFELVFSRDVNVIAASVKLTNGKSFHFDSLGNWGTEEELKKFKEEVMKGNES